MKFIIYFHNLLIRKTQHKPTETNENNTRKLERSTWRLFANRADMRHHRYIPEIHHFLRQMGILPILPKHPRLNISDSFSIIPNMENKKKFTKDESKKLFSEQKLVKSSLIHNLWILFFRLSKITTISWNTKATVAKIHSHYALNWSAGVGI